MCRWCEIVIEAKLPIFTYEFVYILICFACQI